MRGYILISEEDKSSILQQHSTFYNGYATGNVPSEPQPLMVDNGPLDNEGINVNNRGEVSTYKNHLVNESKEETSEDFEMEDDMEDFETELEFDVESASDNLDFPPSFGDEEEDFTYSEDSYGMDLDSIMSMFDGSVDADFDDEMESDEIPSYEFEDEEEMDIDLYEEEQCEGCGSEMYEEKEVCNECGGEMREGECMECGGMYEEMDDDLKESFLKEKQRISEMFDRFKKFN
jgi:hypothetical protein